MVSIRLPQDKRKKENQEKKEKKSAEQGIGKRAARLNKLVQIFVPGVQIFDPVVQIFDPVVQIFVPVVGGG